jgi:hypothetical protein
VTLAGQPVEVTAYEYKLLEYLMLHAGTVISKTELTEHLYQEDEDRDSNVLEVLVGRLRRKLDPDRTLNPIETSARAEATGSGWNGPPVERRCARSAAGCASPPAWCWSPFSA